MHSLLQRIDFEIERHNLLKHRFYRLWSEGKLGRDQLKGYTLEYFQLVKAVPHLVDNVMSCCSGDANLVSVLRENYREEGEHIALWAKFADSMGIKSDQLIDYVASEATMDAVRVLLDLTKISLGQGASAMYGYEKQLPEISRSKIDGLKHFYGLGDSRDGIEYFTVHQNVDIRHAAVWRSIIEDVYEEAPESLLKVATDSLRAQNRVLDGVCERYILPLSIVFN